MKTYINQGKRIYIINNRILEPNKIFNLTDEEYEKVKTFKEIKPLFVEEKKQKKEEIKEETKKEEEIKEVKKRGRQKKEEVNNE